MKEKERYYSPEIGVMQIHSEGVVCASDVDADGLGVGDFPNPFGDNEMPMF